MKKVFLMVALCAISTVAALAAVEKTDVEPICATSVAHNAYEVTLHSINHSPKITKYSVKVEIVNDEVIVQGKYVARDGSGTGYSYVVTIGGILYGFNL
jgi:hypothetical protein